MSTKKKRLQKARQNPKNVTFDDLAAILNDHDFTLDRVTGSHHQFRHEKTGFTLSIPKHGSTVKPVYVTHVLAAIDNVSEDIE